MTIRILAVLVAVLVGCRADLRKANVSVPASALYDVNSGGIESRSISFENTTGERGAGGRMASPLGVGRKGAPLKRIAAGETETLCDITGSGTIRHIWMTGTFKDKQKMLRSIIVRAWWDNQDHPSIEAPLGDLMGLAHARVTAYQSAVHSVGSNAALNLWLPMPFRKHAKITFTNESNEPVVLYYQIDYTLGDQHPTDVGRLHALFRRENPTTLTQDFELLPKRTGKGRFIGCVIGVRSLRPEWWGEGEIKIYKD